MSFDLQNVILLAALVAAAVWTVMTSDLLRSAIGLAVVSVVLTLLLFLLGGPLAAVFELSVCAGLITVVFISVISLTKPWGDAAREQHRRVRLRRFAFLPLVLVLVFVFLHMQGLRLTHAVPPPKPPAPDVREMLWLHRRFDLLGQILVVLAGVFGVVVLFRTRDRAGAGDKS